MKKPLGYVLAYLMWAVVLVLGLWLIVVGRELYWNASAYLVGDEAIHARRVNALEKPFILVLGLLWLAFMVYSEEVLGRSVPRGALLTRFACLAGPELLLLFGVDLALFALQGWSGGWTRWFTLGLELAIGALLVVLGRRRRSPARDAGGAVEAV